MPDRRQHLTRSVATAFALVLLATTACTAAPPAPTAGPDTSPVPSAPPATRTATTQPPTTSPTPSAPTLPKGVTMTAQFGDPWSGKRREQDAVVASAMDIIKQTPRGETLTLSVFNVTFPGFAELLIRTHQRGVRVRILLNHEATGSRGAKALKRALGTNRDNDSWFTVRGGGIRMHSKFLLASRSGGREHVVWMSSGNMTTASGRYQANDALEITGDKQLYDFFSRQFRLMSDGVVDPSRLARSASTRTASVQTFPLPKGGQANDPVAALLDDISCVVGGRQTVVRLAQLFMTDERIWLAERLRELQAEGCDVRVVGYLKVWVDAPDLLIQPGPGKVSLRAVRGKALHTKITTIDGFDASGEPLRVLMAGSHNLTGRALTRTDEGVNDEFAILIRDPATVDAYSAWVDSVIHDHSAPYAG